MGMLDKPNRVFNEPEKLFFADLIAATIVYRYQSDSDLTIQKAVVSAMEEDDFEKAAFLSVVLGCMEAEKTNVAVRMLDQILMTDTIEKIVDGAMKRVADSN